MCNESEISLNSYEIIERSNANLCKRRINSAFMKSHAVCE